VRSIPISPGFRSDCCIERSTTTGLTPRWKSSVESLLRRPFWQWLTHSSTARTSP